MAETETYVVHLPRRLNMPFGEISFTEASSPRDAVSNVVSRTAKVNPGLAMYKLDQVYGDVSRQAYVIPEINFLDGKLTTSKERRVATESVLAQDIAIAKGGKPGDYLQLAGKFIDAHEENKRRYRINQR